MEGATLPQPGTDRQIAVVSLQHVLDNRQAQTRSSTTAAACTVDAIETLGDKRQVTLVDAYPVVADLESRTAVCVHGPADANLPALIRVAHRIHDQVGKRAVQFVLYAVQPTLFQQIDGQLMIVGILLFGLAHDATYQCRHVDLGLS